MLKNSEAIVLRRTDYGEADRIVSFLTPDLGKISVLAKAVRKPASKLAAGIEPLSLVKISVRKGKGDLFTLTSAAMQISWGNIISDYDRLQYAYQALKKINQAAETLQEPELFELLQITLASLDKSQIDRRITEAWFYDRYLQVLGSGVNLSRDTSGQKLSEHNNYRFSTEDMAFYIHENGEFSADHLKVLKLLQLKPPATIARISGVENIIDDCLRLLRNLDN